MFSVSKIEVHSGRHTKNLYPNKKRLKSINKCFTALKANKTFRFFFSPSIHGLQDGNRFTFRIKKCFTFPSFKLQNKLLPFPCFYYKTIIPQLCFSALSNLINNWNKLISILGVPRNSKHQCFQVFLLAHDISIDKNVAKSILQSSSYRLFLFSARLFFIAANLCISVPKIWHRETAFSC